MSDPAGRRPSRAVAGAIAWLSVVQFFVVEELIRRRSTVPYDRRTNYVSDLGATRCGRYLNRTICSPDYVWMNLSFVLVGATIILGVVLIRPALPVLVGLPTSACYAVAGIGAMIVGLFPIDTVRLVHATGAGVFLVAINLGHLDLSRRLLGRGQPTWGIALAALAMIGLIGAALLANGSTLGVGVGFVQRVAIYSSVIDVIVAGLAVLRRGQRHPDHAPVRTA